jgi:tetratricopeptide (TPR) repeat protein
MDDQHFLRAVVLLEQSRHDLAERELRQALAADPDHALAHAYLSQCLLERDQLADATEEAKAAVRLAPELPFAHAALARALVRRNYLREALASAREALRLDPTDADHYALLAGIHLERRDWPAALEAAEEGLGHDAEHVGCNNLRAMALTKLGRTAEAGATIAAALSRDPEDPFSHANQGWTALHEGDTKKALEHFREALRLDPELDYARAGLVEALKARNPIYGLMLRYFLFMSRLSGKAQWAIILGGYVGYQVLRRVGAENPEWMPWVRPLLLAYFVFAVMTWIAAPLFNLLLRLNRYGRHALSADQRRGANLVAAVGLPALVFVLAWLVTGNDLALAGAVFFGFLLLPASAIFTCDAGWPRWCMTAYTILLACLPPAAVALWLVDRALAELGFLGFVWGSVLSGVVANALLMTRAKR